MQTQKQRQKYFGAFCVIRKRKKTAINAINVLRAIHLCLT